MALTDINQKVKTVQGDHNASAAGSLFGTGIGGFLGYLGGGGSGAMQGATLGGQLGKTFGSFGDTEASQKQEQKVNTLQSTAKVDPNVQLATLQNAQMKVPEATNLSQPQAEEIMGFLEQGKQALKQRLAMSNGGTSNA